MSGIFEQGECGVKAPYGVIFYKINGIDNAKNVTAVNKIGSLLFEYEIALIIVRLLSVLLNDRLIEK